MFSLILWIWKQILLTIRAVRSFEKCIDQIWVTGLACTDKCRSCTFLCRKCMELELGQLLCNSSVDLIRNAAFPIVHFLSMVMICEWWSCQFTLSRITNKRWLNPKRSTGPNWVSCFFSAFSLGHVGTVSLILLVFWLTHTMFFTYSDDIKCDCWNYIFLQIRSIRLVSFEPWNFCSSGILLINLFFSRCAGTGSQRNNHSWKQNCQCREPYRDVLEFYSFYQGHQSEPGQRALLDYTYEHHLQWRSLRRCLNAPVPAPSPWQRFYSNAPFCQQYAFISSGWTKAS